MLNEAMKLQVYEALTNRLKEPGVSGGSLAKVANVNDAYVSTIKNKKWDNHSNGVPVPDWVFTRLANALGLGEVVVELNGFADMLGVFEEARQHAESRIIDGATGSGKSYAAKYYLQRFPKQVYLVRCCSDMTERSFMMELGRVVLGRTSLKGLTREEVRREVCNRLGEQRKCLIIVDEAENLPLRSYGALKVIFDDLEGKVGMVLVGANNYFELLKRRANNLMGCFPQVYSRFKFGSLVLNKISEADVMAAARAYGLQDNRELVRELLQASDLREVFGLLKREQRLVNGPLMAQ